MIEISPKEIEQAEGANLFGLVKPTRVSNDMFLNYVALMDLKQSKFVLKEAVLPYPKYIHTKITLEKVAEIAIEIMKQHELIDPDYEFSSEEQANLRVPVEIVNEIKEMLTNMRKEEVQMYYENFSEISQHMQFEAERPITATQMPTKRRPNNLYDPYT